MGVVGLGVGDETGMLLALSDVGVVIIWPYTEMAISHVNHKTGLFKRFHILDSITEIINTS